jgi:hypothetical protein
MISLMQIAMDPGGPPELDEVAPPEPLPDPPALLDAPPAPPVPEALPLAAASDGAKISLVSTKLHPADAKSPRAKSESPPLTRRTAAPRRAAEPCCPAATAAVTPREKCFFFDILSLLPGAYDLSRGASSHGRVGEETASNAKLSTAYRNSGAYGPYAPVGRYPSIFADC